LRSKTEELERKARFFAALPQKMRYYNREKVSAVALPRHRDPLNPSPFYVILNTEKLCVRGTMRIKVVAFDVDGTLYPNSAVYVRSIPFVLRNLSAIRVFARIRKDIRKMRPLADFRRTQARLFAARKRISDEAAALIIEKVFYGRWAAISRKARLFPHVRETLERLRAAGLKLAVLSDFPLERKLPNWNLDGLWDYARSCEDVGYLKPNPEPFLDMVQFFGVKPEEILYVGNHYAYDVLGAKNQGLMAAHITRHAPSGSAADFSFSDFRRLGDWITNI
jgi:putative hydrolase of the HAD superfamily